MNNTELNQIIMFTVKCDQKFQAGIYNFSDVIKAKEYLKVLKKNKKSKNMINYILIDKIKIIIDEITSYYNATFNLVNKNMNVCDYIINLIRKKNLTDPLLIARCAYIELSKYLYYDISYNKVQDESIRRLIVDTKAIPKKEKIFSYVVCTQWFELYQYIMFNFGIQVNLITRENEDHVWGEIELDNDMIIIVDATDYINSSIDLSNAKTVSPTTGFIVLPKEYSHIRLQEIYAYEKYRTILKKIKEYYKLNKDLDITLGYISSEYPIEKILRTNDLFSRRNDLIQNKKEASKYIEASKKFLTGLYIPNNVDGYELYAYYHMYIRNLPMNVRGNIAMKTLYVDTFDYKQTRLRKKFLQTDKEYLKYLYDLINNRYATYMSDEIFSGILSHAQIKNISKDKLSKEILNQELKVA